MFPDKRCALDRGFAVNIVIRLHAVRRSQISDMGVYRQVDATQAQAPYGARSAARVRAAAQALGPETMNAVKP